MRVEPEGSLAGRRVVLGVTGGIAAYKAVDVCRRLVDSGAHVVPVMTAAAKRFLGPATLSALASEPVASELFEPVDPLPHTRIARQADLVVVAPATARLLAAYATGTSNDLLVSLLLATRAPVVVAPAMHAEMWEHPAVVDNVATLRRRGVHVVEPEVGRLAGGDVGAGRLAEPGVIVDAARRLLLREGGGGLAGIRVLVSAGGTREPIDPVRFIGNRSSGRQGHALAGVAASLGADVTLVTSSDEPVDPGVRVVTVETAAEMERQMIANAPEADVVVMSAAVADFRPKETFDRKLHRSEGLPELLLEPTPDILAALAARRRQGQVLVGFAAETDAVTERAAGKLQAKGVDLMVANDVTSPGAGFGHETNAVTILAADGSCQRVELTSKQNVAAAVLEAVALRLPRRDQ
jgi:phosphopantothenoylcysteine decarboxylase / phosphopantothenate---cysteine ligase